jgi:hypothetical protein
MQINTIKGTEMIMQAYSAKDCTDWLEAFKKFKTMLSEAKNKF